MFKNKKVIIILLIIIMAIILGIFIKFNSKTAKNYKIGNNSSSQEIVDYILNINSYKATVNVQVNSNKNTNKYILKQEYNTENGCVQEVIEPSNIAGVRITQKDNNLIIENTNLSLSTIFNEYKGLEENSLDLYDFIKDYNSNSNSYFEENDGIVTLYTYVENNNKYSKNKVLYINKEHILPTKLVIKDNNQNTTIIIEYTDIELN